MLLFYIPYNLYIAILSYKCFADILYLIFLSRLNFASFSFLSFLWKISQTFGNCKTGFTHKSVAWRTRMKIDGKAILAECGGKCESAIQKYTKEKQATVFAKNVNTFSPRSGHVIVKNCIYYVQASYNDIVI